MSVSPGHSVHVPIPFDALSKTQPHWLPFVQRIGERSRCGVKQHLDEIASGQVQIHLAWDRAEKRARALAGTEIHLRGADRIGVLVWCTGSMRELWFPLLNDIERYMREYHGCAGIRAIARPGWSKLLKQNGYRLTHVVMEKD